jgi:hypothetical protein
MHSTSDNIVEQATIVTDESNLISGNIVSSDLNTINISGQFIEKYDLQGYDIDLIKQSVLSNNGQTDFQSKYFVANSQITPYKKVRQALMELEVRYHAYFEINNSLKKAEILDKKFARDIEANLDVGLDLEAEMLKVDKDKNLYDITIWKRKMRQSEIEIKTFLDIIKEHAPDQESLEYFLRDNPEEERKYWILRMGKQAAMDILSFGRLGTGNMDSIAMMDREDQIETLTIAIQYSGIVNANVAAISDNVQKQVNELIAANQLELPLIEDGLEETASNVFSAIESKVNGERLSELPGVSQAQ